MATADKMTYVETIEHYPGYTVSRFRMVMKHTKDSDCTIDPLDGSCVVCGVLGDEPCLVCDGVRYHVEGCQEIEIEP